MIVALASPGIASTIDEGLDKIKRLLSEASAQGAEIVCFPEAYLPGLRGLDFEVPPFDPAQQERVLRAVKQMARAHEWQPSLEWNGSRTWADRLSPWS